MIVIDGSMQSRKYTDDAGNNRVSWSIQADNVYFGDSKRNDSETTAPSSTAAPSDFAPIEGDDEGLPF
jgi:single-strand DNA-binding protein